MKSKYNVPLQNGSIVMQRNPRTHVIRYVVKAPTGEILYRTAERPATEWEDILLEAYTWARVNGLQRIQ
jgi:hypothetical protein